MAEVPIVSAGVLVVFGMVIVKGCMGQAQENGNFNAKTRVKMTEPRTIRSGRIISIRVERIL